MWIISEEEETIHRVARDLVAPGTDRSEALKRRVAERKQAVPTLMYAIVQTEAIVAEEQFFSFEEASLMR